MDFNRILVQQNIIHVFVHVCGVCAYVGLCVHVFVHVCGVFVNVLFIYSNTMKENLISILFLL